ncbi:hypothetical protein RFI_19084 [Reticulomyxa filosa]|uniref:Sulfotransferase domain-containing protein n=1 Tax=Reticulomyxa filosa TaxID=46433 RepID=X6MWH3_RETFI|nr:hypothetical protein RFI_19084 [Reticulomyxa filosa]|eukprot:ETO18194.1 hypothetical protein RFI_19084 [Reticulomyxa filosa]
MRRKNFVDTPNQVSHLPFPPSADQISFHGIIHRVLKGMKRVNKWNLCKQILMYTLLLITFIHIVHVLVSPLYWPSHLVVLWTERHIKWLQQEHTANEGIINEIKTEREKEPMILIGLGCMKCGSSFWQDLLSASNPKNVRENANQKNQINKTWVLEQMKAHIGTVAKSYFIQSYTNKTNAERYDAITRQNSAVIEFVQPTWRADLGYVKECYWRGLGTRSSHYKQCTFEEYVSLWETIAYNWEQHKHVVLVEKTPTYMRDPSGMQLLSYFASQHRIKFYICLRNPVSRTWSHVWFTCKNRQQRCQYTGENVIASLENVLYHKIKHYSHDFYQLFDMINGEEGTDGNDNFVTYIIQLYTNAYYNFVFEMDTIKERLATNDFYGNTNNQHLHHFQTSTRLPYKRAIASLFTSCYYPQIVMIYSYLRKYGLVGESNNVLKIFQMEKVYTNYSALVFDLKCWIWDELLKYPIYASHNRSFPTCQHEFVTLPQDMLLIPSRSPHPGDYAGKITPSLHRNLFLFFQRCNSRLDHFLKSQPHLVLNNYWDIDLWNLQ